MLKTFSRLACLGALTAAAVFCQSPVSRQYTAATLPAASAHPNELFVIRDAANNLDCSTGSGTGIVYCLSNGTSWTAQPAAASSSSFIAIANAASLGTTANKLAKLTGSPSTAVLASTSDVGGMLGIVIAGAGTTGNATVQTTGLVPCAFDGGVTAGDYVQISTSTAGACHDAGSSYPGSGQVLGRVTATTNASAGSYSMQLFGTEARGFTAGGGATKLTATASISPSAIADGTCSAQGTTVPVTGAVTGDAVAVGATPTPATGVILTGQATSSSTVTITMCNFSGASVTPSTSTVAATIVH